jgi:hypothetical protein
MFMTLGAKILLQKFGKLSPTSTVMAKKQEYIKYCDVRLLARAFITYVQIFVIVHLFHPLTVENCYKNSNKNA